MTGKRRPRENGTCESIKNKKPEIERKRDENSSVFGSNGWVETYGCLGGGD
ncbi:MAG: hypothetical protein AVDCRST_MAG02-4090, partial [uncultured Rubrobacteraceae bacterium]